MPVTQDHFYNINTNQDHLIPCNAILAPVRHFFQGRDVQRKSVTDTRAWEVDGQALAHLRKQCCHWRGAQRGGEQADWRKDVLKFKRYQMSPFCFPCTGRGMVDGSNKRRDGWKEIVASARRHPSVQFSGFPSIRFLHPSCFWSLLLTLVTSPLLAVTTFLLISGLWRPRNPSQTVGSPK